MGLSIEKINVKYTKKFVKEIKEKIKNMDSEKQKLIIPDYKAGCKRVLLSDNYYDAIG